MRRVGLITVSGVLLLFVSNIALQVVDVFVPINPFTVLLTGYLGPPGLLALFLIQMFLAFQASCRQKHRVYSRCFFKYVRAVSASTAMPTGMASSSKLNFG